MITGYPCLLMGSVTFGAEIIFTVDATEFCYGFRPLERARVAGQPICHVFYDLVPQSYHKTVIWQWFCIEKLTELTKVLSRQYDSVLILGFQKHQDRKLQHEILPIRTELSDYKYIHCMYPDCTVSESHRKLPVSNKGGPRIELPSLWVRECNQNI